MIPGVAPDDEDDYDDAKVPEALLLEEEELLAGYATC